MTLVYGLDLKSVVDPTKNICKQTIIDLVNCACTFVD